jgi:hypothetical protein
MGIFSDIQVGDTVWLEDRSASYSRNPTRELIEIKVSKVGREYFYTGDGRNGWTDRKFYKSDGWQFVGPNDNGTYKWRAWKYKEGYEKFMEESKERSELESFFRDYTKVRNLTPATIKAILNLIR